MTINNIKIDRRELLVGKWMLVVCCYCKQLYRTKKSLGAGYVISHGCCDVRCAK